MKARLATALSIAGVVVTGGAAFAMNSSILDTTSTAQGSPALATVVAVDASGYVDTTTAPSGAPAPSGAIVSASQVAESMTMAPARPPLPTATTTPATLKPLSLVPGTTAGETESSTSSAPAPTMAPTTAPAATPTVRQFDVAGVGSVFVTVSGPQLGLDRIVITPGSDYVVTNKYVSGDTVRITLTSPTRTVEFSARLANGEIVAAISDPTSALLPPPRRYDDDDDDHEEREHEEREHDREDDDD